MPYSASCGWPSSITSSGPFISSRADLAVVAVVAYFSFGSGYINTLTIELAGAEAGGPTQNAARKEEKCALTI